MAVVTIRDHGVRSVPEGTLLSEVLLPDHPIEMPCGGQGRCGKCRVTALGALSPLSETEEGFLSPEELSRGVRLACCAQVEGDCTVTLPHSGDSRVRLSGEMGGFTLQPLFSRYGAAMDIGTTTLAARLYGADGTLLAEAGAANPQAPWGADVISRIDAALRGSLEALSTAIRQALGGLLTELAERAGISPGEIDYLVITGNTTMLYLLTQTSPEELSHAPFTASRLFAETLPASALELPCPAARVYLPRCISAFVGADITTALLAGELTRDGETRLLVDIGTNGEVALWSDGRLLCCSTAAGPAFEGAGLSMGMQGKAGAIDHVETRGGTLSAHVIGGGAPAGLCGSGVIDAVACLLELELLDETGFLEEDPALISGEVSLTQKDIRMIQLAKSAIHAGISTLLASASLSPARVTELAIAGGFGSYINVENAGRIGLIPGELVPGVRVLGNAALSGAAMLLLDRSAAARSEALAAGAETVDLSSDPKFMDAYTNGMFFPL